MGSTRDSFGSAYTPTPPDELLARVKLRSAQSRRRHLLQASGSLTVVVALVLIGILLPASGARPQPSSQPPGKIVVSERAGSAYELTANEPAAAMAPAAVTQAVESSEIAFSLDLLDRLAASSDASGSDNVLVSPSSLATALAMLELGADGTTLQAIATTLDSAGLSASEQAAGWHSLAALLGSETSASGTNLSHEPELDIANALFLQEHFAVLPAFVRALSSDFQAGLWQVDFAHHLAAAMSSVNQWASDNTKGLIKKLFSPGALNQRTVLVLADAVYFHAHWARMFGSTTTNEDFVPTTGVAEKVPFMNSQSASSPGPLSVPVSTTSQYIAVELPYAGKKLSALVLMPKGTSLLSFVSSLTPSSLGQIISSMSASTPIALSMPTFTEQSDYQLNQTLSSMGMAPAFEFGGFTNITPAPPLAVEAVEQHAYLQVTPRGTTAAAATGVGVTDSALQLTEPIVIDHPFLFLVRDDSTGTILFESMVENPAS
jgi:serpin B